MDEQRQQAYLELVKALLECEGGTEDYILQSHPELVDEGLVKTLYGVATMLVEKLAEKNSTVQVSTIQWLMNLANQLAQRLKLDAEPLSVVSFMVTVYQTIMENDGDPHVVYRLFQDNLHLLNEQLILILPVITRHSFGELNKNDKQLLTELMFRFANLIGQFPLGSRLINMEIAITVYHLILEVLTFDTSPEKWATTQMNLGTILQARIRGNRADNLENAIACYQMVLKVYPRKAYPEQWAMTQMNLAIPYLHRIHGERAVNLEESIACSRLALEVCTREAYPELWATTQRNLANAYWSRIRGERAMNLEKSISCSLLALEIYNRETYPEIWAMTQMNMANAYSNRIQGERAANLEESIKCYRLALEIQSREAYPEGWAKTQMNLAFAYQYRIWGERVINLEESIKCYRLALEVYTRDAYPEQWAGTIMSLATACKNRVRGNQAENLEESIECYQLALEIYTRDAYPEQWARTQLNLAIAYKNRICGERTVNLEKSIACSHFALEVYSHDAYPELWSSIQMNLATAYHDRVCGERTANLEESIAYSRLSLKVKTRKAYPEGWAANQNNLGITLTSIGFEDEAIICFKYALEIRTPEHLPLDCLQTAKNLGDLAFKQGNWQLAIDAYDLAIQAVETSRTWATNDAVRQDILKQAISVYQNTIQAYINLDRLDLAIVTSERARSRQLVDLMATADLYKNGEIPAEVKAYLAEYEALERQIDRLRTNRAADNSDEQRQPALTRDRAALAADTAEIRRLEAEKQVIWQKIRRFDPILAGQKQVVPIDLPTIQSTIDRPHTAILSFYTTDDDTHIFILTRDREPQIHTCKGQGWENFQRWLQKTWLNSYNNSDVQTQIAELEAQIELAEPEGRSEMEAALAEYITQLKAEGFLGEHSWQDLMQTTLIEISRRLELDALVTKLADINELIIIPHLFLHQIPFSALPLMFPSQEGLGVGSNYLGDRFTIRYAPSCQILKYCIDRPAATQIDRYGTVENADGTLPGAGHEGDRLAQILTILPDDRLRGNRATIDNFNALLEHVTHFHFASHAQSRLDAPLESSLKLAGGDLKLATLMISRYPHLQEIFLSCCETHFGTTKITDDTITLGTGFLCAGARTVIGTLWSVNDIATALFSIFYYSNRQAGYGRAEFLKMAQFSLRELSGSDFERHHAADLKASLVAYAGKIKAERKALDRQFRAGSIDQKTRDDEWHNLTSILDKTSEYRETIDKYTTLDRPFAHPFYWAGFTCQGLA